MASLNHVQLIGYLGKDPEIRYLPDGTATGQVSLATSTTWKDKETGEARERTEWHALAFFGKDAETLGKYTKKGAHLYVQGRLRTRKWQDKEGVDRYTTEIVVERFQFLDRKPQDAAPAAGTDGAASSAEQDQPPPDAPADDMVF